jgi:hypothetical protein
MRSLAKVLVCVLAAGAGYELALVLSLYALDFAGVSAFEGQQATIAGFILGPVGALGGLWAGGWAAQRLFREPSNFGRVVRLASAALVLIGALASLGVLVSVLFSGEARYTNTAPPKLHFEVRIPASSVAESDQRRWRVNLDTASNQMPASLERPFRSEGGNVVISGNVELYFKTRQRILAIDLGDGRALPIRLNLPAALPASTEWSPWTRVDATPLPAELRTRLTVY